MRKSPKSLNSAVIAIRNAGTQVRQSGKSNIYFEAKKEIQGMRAGKESGGETRKNEEQEKEQTRKKFLDNIFETDIKQLLDELKDKITRKHRISIEESFKIALYSHRFDNFIKHAVNYSLWFIRLTFLEKTHEEALQESELIDKSKAANKFTEAKKLLFGDDAMVPYDMAVEAKEKAFKGLACAYCFLLLHVSTITRNLAKERLFFEHLYNYTRHIIDNILLLPGFTTVIDHELDRIFRSELFCNVYDAKETAAKKKADLKKRQVNSHVARYGRSPLVDAILPPAPKFLFLHTN